MSDVDWVDDDSLSAAETMERFEALHPEPTALVPRQRWEQNAAALVDQYAGFTNAVDLSPEEQLASLVSLVPMALAVVAEARDTIERLNAENDMLRRGEEIEDAELEE